VRCVNENRKKRKRLRFLQFSFTQRMQRTQRKRLRLNRNRARPSLRPKITYLDSVSGPTHPIVTLYPDVETNFRDSLMLRKLTSG